MKKLLIIFCLFISGKAWSQNNMIWGKTVQATRDFILTEKIVNAISEDSSEVSKSAMKLITERAIKLYVDRRSITGSGGGPINVTWVNQILCFQQAGVDDQCFDFYHAFGDAELSQDEKGIVFRNLGGDSLKRVDFPITYIKDSLDLHILKYGKTATFYVTAGTAGAGGRLDSTYITPDSLWRVYKYVGGRLDSSNVISGITDTTALHDQIGILNTAVRNRFDSLRNNAGVLEGRKGGVFIPQFTLPASGGISSGAIAWPGTIYSTPTTGSVVGSAITFSPSLANQSSYTVFGNHTSGSAAPSFGKLPVNSISATGTPSSSTYLRGDGSWAGVAGGGISTVTGTTNRISISGTSTDPIFDISSSYVGQSSINTLGTIGTGTWNGTAIGTAYAGSPSGGTTGQVLTKNTNTNYDYSWATASGGLSGSGVATRLAFWNGTGSLTSDTSLRFAPLGVTSDTKVQAGFIIRNNPTALANTDTLVGIDITQWKKQLSFTGVMKYDFKSGMMFYRTDSLYNISIGAGNPVVSTSGNAIFMGHFAGENATGASRSVFMGENAGRNATNASSSFFMGQNSGNSASAASSSVFIGSGAGSGGTNAYQSIFMGPSAGNSATNANNSNFLGISAGDAATGANNSNFLGPQAGRSATGAFRSNFLGLSAGDFATSASSSNFFGVSTGAYATGATGSDFMGIAAGYRATGASNSHFFGNSAGQGATGASNSTFIGYHVGDSSTYNITGSNNIMMGTNITLPTASTANSLNFGNVLYGVNLYSTTTGSPASAAQTTGRIGINVSTPAVSAYLDITGTAGGLLLPRVTKTQRDAISTPVAGLAVYQTDNTPGLRVYNGTNWMKYTETTD